MNILVFNCGSSSLKFELLEIEAAGRTPGTIRRLAGGSFAEIGSRTAIIMSAGDAHKVESSEAVQDHQRAAIRVINWLNEVGIRVDAVAHRIVHGGPEVTEPVIVTDAVIRALENACQFAPLHNPPALSVLRAVGSRLREVPSVVIPDTAFHQTIPPAARTYAIPRSLTERYGIRRFGFHGIGHAWMMERCAAMRATDPEKLNLITLHLGAGCSATAIRQGRSIDTSMGLTPLEGLMMATRAGDIDPAIFTFLAAREKLSPDQVEYLLNHQSGLLGVSAVSDDLREIEAEAHRNQYAALAIEMFCYRVRKYIGAYMAVLGHTDAIVFGGGIGEHSASIREQICSGLNQLGVLVNRQANRNASGHEAQISEPQSPVSVYVVPLDEETYMARAAVRVLSRASDSI
jgi:acetate kinase